MVAQRSEEYNIDQMDGFEFEHLCAKIFDKLAWGYVKVTPQVGDGGVDVIIKTKNGEKIFVECKNQPKTSIGRPVIQKLHSAVVSLGASRGIVITTGKFSSKAIDHASQLKPSIELYDLTKLTELASLSGIEINSEIQEFKYFVEPKLHERFILDQVMKRLKTIYSYPNKIDQLVDISISNDGYFPIYRITYDIVQTFSTTTYVVHKINDYNQEIYLDGKTFNHVSSSISALITQGTESKRQLLSEISEFDRPIFPSSNINEVYQKAKHVIISKYQTTVKYTGRNNVTYFKSCIPSANHISIKNLNILFLHYRKIGLNNKNFNRYYGFVDGQTKALPNYNFPYCDFCGSKDKLIACNDCGTFADYGFRKHGKICKKCNKTLCLNCTYKRRFPTFVWGYLCKECALEKFGKNRLTKKKARKTILERQWRKNVSPTYVIYSLL